MFHLINFSTNNNYTKPTLRERIKKSVANSSKGGKPGQWSAVKSMILSKKYREAGGTYKSSKLTKPQSNLKKWQKEKWKTKSGKPSLITGERFLPAKAIKAMSSQQYAASTRMKKKGTSKGLQYVPQSKKAVQIANKYR